MAVPRTVGRAAPGLRAQVSARRLALRVAGSTVGVRTTVPQVGLTFDDGPDPAVTPRLLDALERRGARATFFVLGRRAEEHAELTREVAARGHQVGLHGDEHLLLTRASAADVVRVVRGGAARLERVLGERPRLFRPPYGSQGPLAYAVARSAGLRVVGWTAIARDWVDQPVPDMVGHVLSTLRPGGLVLLHDRFEPHPLADHRPPAIDRVALIEGLLDELGARGWRARTVDQLLAGAVPQRRLWFRRDG